MAEKAIRLGGESTADAIVSAVDAMYTEHTFAEKDFALKHNEDEISVDTNFAAQNFWKEALIRFFNKKSAVLGLVLIVVIVLLAVLGPGMNSYTYSGQDLSQKNFAPRVPGIEQFGILDGSEKMSTTTGTKMTNAYQEKDKLDVYYWFGSDLYGRDIWTRTWEGARVSLIIAVAAAIIDMLIGMMVALGILIGLAVLYTSALISFEELKRELSVMLMLGLTAGECLEVISVGQWILTAGGVLLGIPMTFWMSHAFAVSMSAKMFSIPDFADTASVAESAVLMFIAVFISSRLILRKLKAVSPVSLLMERE